MDENGSNLNNNKVKSVNHSLNYKCSQDGEINQIYWNHQKFVLAILNQSEVMELQALLM